MIPIPIPRRGAAALLLFLAAACADGGVAPVLPDAPSGPGAVRLARLDCRVNVPTQRVSCGDAATTGGARGAVILGGQGVYVQLLSSNVVYSTGAMSFDLTVQNLMSQVMGTPDGVTSTGVQVFFDQGPTVTTGTGTVAIANPDGFAAFTAAGQPYFDYAGTLLGSDGILSPSETSAAKSWQFFVSPTVVNFSFTLLVATEIPFPAGWVDVTPPTATVDAGATLALTATSRDLGGGIISGTTMAWSSSDAAVATVDASGVVTGVAPGTATIFADDGTNTGSATVQVCPALAVGGVYTADAPLTGLCLGGGGAGAEYAVVPINLSASSVSLTTLASGIVAVSGAPTPARLPAARDEGGLAADAPPTDTRVGTALREREAEVLRPLMSRARELRARSGGPRFVLVPGTPLVGDLMTLNVNTGTCSGSTPRGARVEAVGTRVVVMADTTNPADGLSSADYASIAAQFDTLVWPALTTPFGAPYDLDGNGDRVVVFYTRAVNALTASAAAPVAGLTLKRDLYSSTLCANSNQGEMIYMMAADPTGTVNSNVRTVSLVKGLAATTMGHELQHLINASRRLYVNSASVFEETWLDEGLSDIAEELLFYRASVGLTPRGNIVVTQLTTGPNASRRVAAFNAHANPNFTRLRANLQAPHSTSADQRGRTWAYLRYVADRTSGSEDAFWNALVNSISAGEANLSAAVGGAATGDLYRDFSGALYADDAVTGVSSTYTNPSWNFRSLYIALNGSYPLLARDLADGVARTDALGAGGGTAYLRLGVTTGNVAALTFSAGGAAPPVGMRWLVIRRK
ncbi:MAG TPA: Ig-like domain-containing protein [Longimicrobium sp.]|nr:Ig-like domain-containing protein [Longimicrobium sp.]